MTIARGSADLGPLTRRNHGLGQVGLVRSGDAVGLPLSSLPAIGVKCRKSKLLSWARHNTDAAAQHRLAFGGGKTDAQANPEEGASLLELNDPPWWNPTHTEREERLTIARCWARARHTDLSVIQKSVAASKVLPTLGDIGISHVIFLRCGGQTFRYREKGIIQSSGNTIHTIPTSTTASLVSSPGHKRPIRYILGKLLPVTGKSLKCCWAMTSGRWCFLLITVCLR